MKSREFLKSGDAIQSLTANQQHGFALRYAMSIFASSALFTFIPKNACSTMRFSIAKANGCVSDLSQVHWIHANNQTFAPTSEAAFKASYTLVILRCPFQRLYSAFMDKMVSMDIQAWQFCRGRGRRFLPHDLSFRRFVEELSNTPTRQFDIHWRPQTDFLLFKTYDDYFCMEQFRDVIPTIEKNSGLEVVDTRAALEHDLSQLERSSNFDAPADMPALDLLLKRRMGIVPEPRSMFDRQTAAIVAKLYPEDLALYEEKFGKSDLMQDLL